MKRASEHPAAVLLALLCAGTFVSVPQVSAQAGGAEKAAARPARKAAPAAPSLPPAAPGVTDVHVLGGIHAFCTPPLKSGADLLKLFQTRRQDVEKILTEAGWAGRIDDLYAAVARGDAQEVQFPVGGTMQWMALAKKKKPDILRSVRWAGKKPTPAYEIKVESNDVRYTFVVPKPCGNLALVDSTPIPPPVARISVIPASDCITRPLAVDASASSVSSGSISNVTVTITLPDGKTEELSAADAAQAKWTRSWRAPGKYGFTAVATSDSGRKSEPARAEGELKPCPPNCALNVSPSEVYQHIEEIAVDASGSKAQVGTLQSVAVDVAHEKGEPKSRLNLTAPFRSPLRLDTPGHYALSAVAEDDLGQKSTNSCAAAVDVRPRLGLVLDAFGGKERRGREEFGGGRCAPLVGAKAGLSYMVTPSFELAGLGGVAVNTRDSDNTSLLADLEANWRSRMRGTFFGVGIGAWDFTHSDDVAADFLVHGGIDLPWKVGKNPVAFFVQGRMLLDQTDDIDNNYIVLGGLRFRPHN